MIGIYQIKNVKNNKIYIGSSTNILKRWETHIGSLNNKEHVNYKLQKDFNKYGIATFCFSIIELVKDKKDLFRREQLYIDTIDIKHNYNILDYAASEFNKNVDKQIINFCLNENDSSYLRKNINIIKNEKLNNVVSYGIHLW